MIVDLPPQEAADYSPTGTIIVMICSAVVNHFLKLSFSSTLRLNTGCSAVESRLSRQK